MFNRRPARANLFGARVCLCVRACARAPCACVRGVFLTAGGILSADQCNPSHLVSRLLLRLDTVDLPIMFSRRSAIFAAALAFAVAAAVVPASAFTTKSGKFQARMRGCCNDSTHGRGQIILHQHWTRIIRNRDVCSFLACLTHQELMRRSRVFEFS